MYELLEKTYEDSYNIDISGFISDLLVNNKKKLIVTINPETYVWAEKNKTLKNILLNQETILIPDSIAVIYKIRKVLKKKINKYPGVDIFKTMLEMGNKYNKKIYLYGAKEEVNQKMEKLIKTNYKSLKVVGKSNGYEKNVDKIKNSIIKLKPDIVAVALGVPNQELFNGEVYDKLDKGIIIGVGGSFDALTNYVKRAPKFFQKLNLEWLYRIVKEPKRLKRFYMNNIRFVLKLVKVKK